MLEVLPFGSRVFKTQTNKQNSCLKRIQVFFVTHKFGHFILLIAKAAFVLLNEWVFYLTGAWR
jgi:hypothetical protein